MLKYLLDTNIVIYVVKRRPLEVLSWFNENAGRMATSTITLSELYHGAEKKYQGVAKPGGDRGVRQLVDRVALHRQSIPA